MQARNVLEGGERIAVVMACHNRRDTTLSCLRRLFAQLTDGIEIEVYLFDDASADATAEAVADEFSHIQIIGGDGKRFWGGGMYAAMCAAAKREHDFFLWLNDDVLLNENALSILLAAHKRALSEKGPRPHIIVGAVTDPIAGHVTYSGFLRRNRWHPVQFRVAYPCRDALAPCDTMNGNCVLIPAEVVKRIGTIDPRFVQQLGDLDYGYRAVCSGASLWVAPDAVGTCSSNPKSRRWQDPLLSPLERLRALNSPLGLPIRPWATFMWRYGGGIGVCLFVMNYLGALARGLRAWLLHEIRAAKYQILHRE